MCILKSFHFGQSVDDQAVSLSDDGTTINQSINQFIISNFSKTAILPADKLQYYTI